MPNIHQELLIAASVEKVYEALTTQEGLSGWWAPGTTAKPEVGSVARFPFGPDYHKEMKIEVLERPSRVQWKCIEGDKEWIGTTLTFQLHGQDSATVQKSHPEASGQLRNPDGTTGTLLHFAQDNWRAYTPTFAECSYTWDGF
jgi:uncharacterized protein YndB with AHSA1/START domain